MHDPYTVELIGCGRISSLINSWEFVTLVRHSPGRAAAGA